MLVLSVPGKYDEIVDVERLNGIEWGGGGWNGIR